MKLYANNKILASQLLETAFTILRNEGLEPVDCMAMVHDQLIDGIDVSHEQRAALRGYLRGYLRGLLDTD